MVVVIITNVKLTKEDTTYKLEFDISGKTYPIKLVTAPTDQDISNEIKNFIKSSKVGIGENQTITKTSYSYDSVLDTIS